MLFIYPLTMFKTVLWEQVIHHALDYSHLLYYGNNSHYLDSLVYYLDLDQDIRVNC
jgi:hypothetical protein